MIRMIETLGRGAVATLLLAGLAACSGAKTKPTCPVPDGVKCMDTLSVYEATNFSETIALPSAEKKSAPAPVSVVTADAPPAPVVTVRREPPSGPRPPVAYRPVEYATAAPQGDTLRIAAPVTPAPVRTTTVAAQVTPAVANVSTNSESPYRVPAKVMRVWINAWEDDEGDLHLPGHIFSEIEPRRWSVGHKASDSEGTNFHLLESLGPAAKESRGAPASANAAASRPSSQATPPLN